MRKSLRVINVVLALLTVFLLFISYLKSNFIAGILRSFSPIASKIHLSALFAGDSEFYSYLVNGIVLSFLDYRSNQFLYYALIILAIIVIVALDATVLNDNQNGQYDKYFLAMALIGTALFGVEFVAVIIIFLAIAVFRFR